MVPCQLNKGAITKTFLTQILADCTRIVADIPSDNLRKSALDLRVSALKRYFSETS